MRHTRPKMKRLAVILISAVLIGQGAEAMHLTPEERQRRIRNLEGVWQKEGTDEQIHLEVRDRRSSCSSWCPSWFSAWFQEFRESNPYLGKGQTENLKDHEILWSTNIGVARFDDCKGSTKKDPVYSTAVIVYDLNGGTHSYGVVKDGNEIEFIRGEVVSDVWKRVGDLPQKPWFWSKL